MLHSRHGVVVYHRNQHTAAHNDRLYRRHQKYMKRILNSTFSTMRWTVSTDIPPVEKPTTSMSGRNVFCYCAESDSRLYSNHWHLDIDMGHTARSQKHDTHTHTLTDLLCMPSLCDICARLPNIKENAHTHTHTRMQKRTVLLRSCGSHSSRTPRAS